jgi:hypothetical protein
MSTTPTSGYGRHQRPSLAGFGRSHTGQAQSRPVQGARPRNCTPHELTADQQANDRSAAELRQAGEKIPQGEQDLTTAGNEVTCLQTELDIVNATAP